MNWDILTHPMTLLILIPGFAALLAYLIRPLRRYAAIVASLITGFFALRLFLDVSSAQMLFKPINLPEIFGIINTFRVDGLSAVMLLLVSGFSILFFIYSFKFKGGPRDDWKFFTFALLTYAAANGALLAGSVLVLYFFWGILLFSVYGLLLFGKGNTELAARKMFLLNGFADFLLLLGLMIFMIFTTKHASHPGQLSYFTGIGTSQFKLNNPLAIASFIFIAIGAVAKAGSFPLHTWIPKAAETAPAETMAFIPSMLDKILGIYLFIRLCYSIFDIKSNLTIQLIFLSLGAVTVLGAVFMALIQKDAMRLLSYHAVSQVGYMILGIASGSIIGIAGGLFHMINNTVYKSALFLGVGAVNDKTGETNLDNLGGLAKAMPITFFSFLVCALAISGVPPLNGFVSKWLIYQSFIGLSTTTGNSVFYIFMIAGMFGSVLTLASFLKLTHSIFLGRRPVEFKGVKEVSFNKWLPPFVLAITCIAFGIFAFRLPLRFLISPSLPSSTIQPIGYFSPLAFVALMSVLLSLGFLIYLIGGAYKPRSRKVFLGAEELTEDEMHFSASHFYSSIKKIKFFGEFYRFAEGGSFDLFNYLQGIGISLGKTFKTLIDDSLNKLLKFIRYFVNLASEGLSRMQTGRLSFYLGWTLFGILVLILLLIGGGGGA